MSKNVLQKLIGKRKSDCNVIAQVLKLRPHYANKFDKAGNSLLHQAVEKNELGVIKILLDCGADPNARNCAGYTPLHFAVIFKNINALELLIKNNTHVNARSNSGKTPLHLLSIQEESEESIKIAEILLRNYASTSVRDAGGMTPLDYLNSMR